MQDNPENGDPNKFPNKRIVKNISKKKHLAKAYALATLN